ncbi:hypothetical protein CHLRE_06g301650v5 [Chlamydomonas reinhardtii]|uniref:Uncharacterized protein n=1 Tax=Chlamydomonas reinhardtii TaxID=3055 RepID=A0A2K3DR05_CHLRE|nr:uncharacterized protein CHLRE_06g301650v5 [Chlamydomonas reinhardtii]PNW82969.1 hypothetical protein CHLRE_06g301650v5 [Chlamydomonas reinhardtii]
MSLLRTGRCPTAIRHTVDGQIAPLAPLAARPVVAAPTRTVIAHGERRSANRTKWATAEPPSGAAGPAVAESPVREQTVAEQIWDCAQDLAPVFTEVDRLVAANVRKVQKAFRDHRIGPHHFQGSTGYGHGDLGREALDSVMAQIMGAEAALMRVQFVSGTHAIASALYSVLRPGDEMLAVAGHPYDTMEEVIGTRGTPGHGSLMEWGVSYRELGLTSEGRIDWEALKTAVVPGKTKVAHIQRSCGYALRPTLSIDEIGKAVQIIKAQDPNVVVTVDNCYGEFTDTREPCDVGADLAMGSLIKNPGGTIAPGGGYVAGRADLIGAVAARLYAPGIGIDAGGVPGSTLRIFFQGLFLAPQTTGEALKGGRLAAELLHREGFTVIPAPGVPDVWSMITAVELRSRERMTAFCRGIQRTCPIGSYITPEPGVTAGYGDEVIFADGTFIDGSTAELSADGPIRAPYVVYCQGGTHWTHWALALEGAVTSLREAVAKDN